VAAESGGRQDCLVLHGFLPLPRPLQALQLHPLLRPAPLHQRQPPVAPKPAVRQAPARCLAVPMLPVGQRPEVLTAAPSWAAAQVAAPLPTAHS